MVGFVEHEGLDGGKRVAPRRQMVEQPPGGRHEHFKSAIEHVRLRTGRDAADDHADLQRRAHELAVFAEALGDLSGEFARRSEHERADAAGNHGLAVGEQPRKDRQCESRGLAGAGLGDAEQVALLQKDGYGLRLDRRGRLISGAVESAQQRLGKAEIGKLSH